MKTRRSRDSNKASGRLVIIGGAEDKEGECRILKEFVRLSGGEKARVVVIAVASDNPSTLGARYTEVFRRLGASEARYLDISSRQDANDPAALEAIKGATGVFFTGGTQLRITRLLGGTEIDTALHKLHEEGLVLAGTSAGAAMMSSVMIVGGLSSSPLRVGIVELGPGMEFVSGVLIDQHFEQRGRLRRLLSAVAQYPRDLGVGIDEDTAIVTSGHWFEVIGEGSVTVIDAGALTYTNLLGLNKNDMLALCGVKIHILPAGYGFDLQNRLPLVKGEAWAGAEAASERKSVEGSARNPVRARAPKKPRGAKKRAGSKR
ncbi:MAG TPA: cyanophycinase [Blastocatellia bacterium]|nr:cyanophycinase [Blastocatellia bacterium]